MTQIKKIKDWKKNVNHQFAVISKETPGDFGILLSGLDIWLERIKDGECFIVDFPYYAGGFVNGTTLTISGYHKDMINVSYELKSSNGEGLTCGTIEINNMIRAIGTIYLRPEEDCQG